MSLTVDARPAPDPAPTLELELEDLAVAAEETRSPALRARLHEDMVVLALPLADGIARRYIGRGIETDDLIQVARTGLVKAVRRYRPSKGCAFAAYATPTISGELKRWFRDHGWSVRPPRRVQELRHLLALEEERLQSQLSRRPSDDEVAEALGVDRSELDEVRLCSLGYRAASLDGPADSTSRLADRVLVTESPTEAWDTSDALGRAIANLSERQRLILRLRFLDDCTQAQIAERIGVSQMQVSRLLRAMLTQLRDELEDVLPHECLWAV